jgi:hypothetical protein
MFKKGQLSLVQTYEFVRITTNRITINLPLGVMSDKRDFGFAAIDSSCGCHHRQHCQLLLFILNVHVAITAKLTPIIKCKNLNIKETAAVKFINLSIIIIIVKKLNQFLTVCKGHHNRGNDTWKTAKIIVGVRIAS